MFKIAYSQCNEGGKMRKQWVEKNVDLALLSENIEDFFRGTGFRTKRDESVEEYKILVIPQRAQKIRENVKVKILGNSNDFIIELSAGDRARRAIRFGYLTNMIGGGSLLLQGLKSREALERLEKEFWVYVEDAVGRLADSSKASV
jgi:hypothetical protein